MNLRSLLRDNRFAGCSNPRQTAEPFCKNPDHPLTLCCAQVPEGLRLQLRDRHESTDILTLPLSSHIVERINFWNLWASYAFEHEYEYTPSLYGLECYATSIAMDIARALPDRPVDYCGLPVHDDFALCLHLRKDRIPAYDANFRDPHCACPLAPDITPNRYLQHLLTETANTATQLPLHGYRGWGDFDYCCGYLHFDPAEHPYTWMGHETSFDISPNHGFPQWLCELVNEWEESLLDARYENMRWAPCTTLLQMQEDALAVDIARYHRPLIPIAISERFYTGEDILTLADSSQAQ